MDEYRPIRFISEPVEVAFDEPPALEKSPGCPQRFTWQGKTYTIVELIAEWHNFSRRGKMARNMRPAHAAKAERRGSWGVAEFGFRVKTDSEQVFDLLYDRSPRSVDDRKGGWHLERELAL